MNNKISGLKNTIQIIMVACLALYGVIMLTGQSVALWQTKDVAAQETTNTLAASTASIPFVISYQGELYDDSGTPLNGRYTLSFRIYADAVSTDALWTEPHGNVTVQAGHFNVLLGSQATLPETLFTNGNIPYLGVTVHPNPEMLPRQRFQSVPFALRANYADLAQDANNAENAVNATTLTGTLPGSQIVNDSIGLDKLNFVDSAGNINFGENMAFDDGALNIQGGINLQGNIAYQAVKQVDLDEPTAYAVTTRRYHVEATKAQEGNTIPLDMDIIYDLCRDGDGCAVTLGMRDWDNNAPGRTTSRGPYRLFLSETSTHFQMSNTDWHGMDGNGTVHHIVQAWDCYFTDGEYTNASGSDNHVQLGLLNAINRYRDPDMVCVLTIDD
ncbi:MAG: hypothetical protein AAF639_13885 [Chloroflexota bacterium]